MDDDDVVVLMGEVEGKVGEKSHFLLTLNLALTLG